MFFMSLYESIIILKQEVASSAIDQLLEEWKKILENGEAKVIKQEYLGSRSLAYKIDNNIKAHYIMMSIDGPYSAIKEYERRIRLSEHMIRFVTTEVEKFTDAPVLRGRMSTEPAIDVTQK